MKLNAEDTRNLLLNLLEETRRETRSALSGIDSERVVHLDDPAWRVRDVVGHLGVWNGEAAKSLKAHVEGGEYHCIPSEAKYDEYNGSAVEERRTWKIEQVWAEYEESTNHLKLLVQTIPAEKLTGKLLYPWNERGTVQNLIEVMMIHEAEHREIILQAGA